MSLHQVQRFQGSPPALDLSYGDMIFVTLNGANTIPALENPLDGQEVTFIFDGTGTAVWGPVYGSVPGPTLFGSTTAAYTFVYDANHARWDLKASPDLANIFRPAGTDAAIRAAALSAYNAGAGVVKLPAAPVVAGLSVPITLLGSLPMYSGVTYEGVPPKITAPAAQQQTGANNALNEILFNGGTILQGDGPGSFPLFAANTQDYNANNSWPNNLGALYLYKGGLRSIGAMSCAGLIRVGGMNNVGFAGGTVMDDLWVNDWTDWAFFFANCGEINWGYLAAIFSLGGTVVNGTLRGDCKGHIYYGGLGQASTAGIPGDGVIQNIFGFGRRDAAAPVPRVNRGIVLEAAGSQGLQGAVNGFTIVKAGQNFYKPGLWTQQVTFVNNSPLVTVAVGHGADLRVGMPVMFPVTGYNFNGLDAQGAYPNNWGAGGAGGGWKGGGSVYFVRYPGLKVGDPLPGDTFYLSASRNSVSAGEKFGSFTVQDATHIVCTVLGGSDPLVAGDSIMVGEDANGEVKTIASMAGNVAQLTTALANAHPAPGSTYGLFYMSLINATGSGAMNMQTRGFPQFEAVTRDPISAVSNVFINSINGDGNSSLGYYMENLNSSEVNIEHEEPPGAQDLGVVMRRCQLSQLRVNQAISTDIDATCDTSSYSGIRHGFRNRTLRGLLYDDISATHRSYEIPGGPAVWSGQADASITNVTVVGDHQQGYFQFDSTGVAYVPGNRLLTFLFAENWGIGKVPNLELRIDPKQLGASASTLGWLDWNLIFNGPPVALSTQGFAIYLTQALPLNKAGIRIYYKLGAGS